MLRTSGSRSALPVPTVLAVVRRRPCPASSAPTVPLGQGSGGHVPAGPSACRPLAGRRTWRFASQGASQGALLRTILLSRGRAPHRAQAASQCARVVFSVGVFAGPALPLVRHSLMQAPHVALCQDWRMLCTLRMMCRSVFHAWAVRAVRALPMDQPIEVACVSCPLLLPHVATKWCMCFFSVQVASI